MRILITGGCGFIGSYLADALVGPDHQVTCTYLPRSGGGPTVEPPLGAALRECDVNVPTSVWKCLADTEPDVIFHLAAQSLPTVSLKQPAQTLVTNAGGTANLLAAVRERGIHPIVVVAGSSAVYGDTSHAPNGVAEDAPIRPSTPYGISKWAQERVALHDAERYGMHVVVARIFNTTGPGKTNDVCSDLVDQIVRYERGEVKRVSVGNLHVARAFCDVRDLVRGLQLLAVGGEPGQVYNLGGLRPVTVRSVLETLLNGAGLESDVVFEDPERQRKQDELCIWGDIAKARGRLGWEPRIELAETLAAMLNRRRGVG